VKKLEKKILRLIKASDGTTWEDIAAQLCRPRSSLRKARNTLYQEGYIANYYGGSVRIFHRSIDVYKKGYKELVSENYHKHGFMTSRAEVLVEEIELPNQITVSQLRKTIAYVEDDYYYHWTYGIDGSTAVLFERTNNVKFDFEKFEYILG
jgi:hypothetical protein